jgi:hypothetical protein
MVQVRIALVSFMVLAGLALSIDRHISDHPECRIEIGGVERFPGVASTEHPICLWSFRWHTGQVKDQGGST